MTIHQGKLWIICDIYSLYLKHQVVLNKYLFIIELNFVPDTFINLSIKIFFRKTVLLYIFEAGPWHSQIWQSLFDYLRAALENYTLAKDQIWIIYSVKGSRYRSNQWETSSPPPRISKKPSFKFLKLGSFAESTSPVIFADHESGKV